MVLYRATIDLEHGPIVECRCFRLSSKEWRGHLATLFREGWHTLRDAAENDRERMEAQNSC